MRSCINMMANLSGHIQRFAIAGALLVTASAQKGAEKDVQGYCFDTDNPQSILIAKQSKESIEMEGAEIFVKSEFRDESGKKTVWIYETRSTHTSEGLEQTSDDCLRQAFD